MSSAVHVLDLGHLARRTLRNAIRMNATCPYFVGVLWLSRIFANSPVLARGLGAVFLEAISQSLLRHSERLGRDALVPAGPLERLPNRPALQLRDLVGEPTAARNRPLTSVLLIGRRG